MDKALLIIGSILVILFVINLIAGRALVRKTDRTYNASTKNGNLTVAERNKFWEKREGIIKVLDRFGILLMVLAGATLLVWIVSRIVISYS